MPSGTGTYGSQVGRPPKKNKKKSTRSTLLPRQTPRGSQGSALTPAQLKKAREAARKQGYKIDKYGKRTKIK